MSFSFFLLLVPNLSGIPLVHNYELVKALKMRNPVLRKVLTREVNLGREVQAPRGGVLFHIRIYEDVDSGKYKIKSLSTLAILDLSGPPQHAPIRFQAKYSENQY